MRDVQATASKLKALKSIGVRIAIDDFGTGYSSLAYLRQFPIDILKIDQSFIVGSTETTESAAIVHTLVRWDNFSDLRQLPRESRQSISGRDSRQRAWNTGRGTFFLVPLNQMRFSLSPDTAYLRLNYSWPLKVNKSIEQVERWPQLKLRYGACERVAHPQVEIVHADLALLVTSSSMPAGIGRAK